MIQYEYKIESVSMKNLTDELNQFGKEGWRLNTILTHFASGVAREFGGDDRATAVVLLEKEIS
ncbi:MAG TPA: hypothetical protein VMV66_00990 [Candidatus Humimicrobiaceae bacterium]|nr:hypothetical protein [Candidatus Humimicrobiaceae bacterium]